MYSCIFVYVSSLIFAQLIYFWFLYNLFICIFYFSCLFFVIIANNKCVFFYKYLLIKIYLTIDLFESNYLSSGLADKDYANAIALSRTGCCSCACRSASETWQIEAEFRFDTIEQRHSGAIATNMV